MVRLIKPYISFEEVKKEFKEIFDSGMLTSSTYSKQFPKEMCLYTGAKYAFNTTSATTALALALDVLNVDRNDEVIVSDFSFPATVNVVEQRGAKPIFADVDRETYNMSAKSLKESITPKTKAVIFVCAVGNPTGIHSIKAICEAHNIPLIVDAACALGSSENAVKIGNIGDISCFSFHPRKLLTSGEGGSITTSNDKYAEMMNLRLNHGASVIDGNWDFVTYGYNYRLPELQCLMLIKQLQKLDAIVKERVKSRDKYTKLLMPHGMQPQSYGTDAVHNMQSVVFTVPEDIDRDSLIAYLKEQDIEARMGTYCQSNTTFYRNKYNSVQKNALWLEQNTISLPCYHGVEEEYVAEKICDYIEKKKENT